MLRGAAGSRQRGKKAIRRETEEETGYKIGAIEKVFESYMSPGSVTEILVSFMAAEYTKEMKVSGWCAGWNMRVRISRCWRFCTAVNWTW